MSRSAGLTQSCNTVYDIRQECSTKYVEFCDNITNPVKTSRNLSRQVGPG